MKPVRSVITVAVLFCGEVLLGLLTLFAMDGLGHLRLRPATFAVCALAWPTGLLAARWIIRDTLAKWRPVLEVMLTAVLLAVIAAALGTGLKPTQIIYAAGFTGVMTWLWRRWLKISGARGGLPLGEAIRLIVVGSTGVWVALPMFTDLLVGGVDARWYSYMLADFIEQWRAGVFPVFVGQGEFAYNGGVHPFRSAPFFQFYAGVWDSLTFHALSVIALQHLTVIASALVGALGMYAALTSLAPERRWMAMAIAVIYVTSPAFLGVIYSAEAYMTFMAVGVLPILVYGQLKILQPGGAEGWPWLAAGLALVWCCHAGVAVFCTLATLLIQGGRLLLTDQLASEWKRAVGAACLFFLLAGYYFLSMAELPPLIQGSRLPSLLQLIGMAFAVAGLIRGVLWRQGWAWALLLVGVGLLQWTQPAWMWAAVLATVLAGGLAMLARWRHWFEPREHAWALALGSLLLVIFLMPPGWVETFPNRHQPALSQLRLYVASVPGFFSPVVSNASYYQPGFGVLVLLAGVTWSALVDRSLRARLLLVPLLLLVLSCRPLPRVSEFLVAFFPEALTRVTNFPLDYRLFPVLVAFACGGGFVWAAELADRHRGAYRVIGGGLVLLGAWSVFQARPYLQTGWSGTNTRAQSAQQFRSETAVLSRYAYDQMRIPDYFSHGKTDVRLESRIFDRAKNLLVGPDQIARQMEALAHDEKLVTTAVEPTGPAWLNLAPKLTLAPGEHLLLRFEFLPKTYDGWLILKSENIYREYQMPDSGWPRAFGVAAGRSKVISLWNSGSADEHVALFFKRNGPATAADVFGDFGRITLSHFQPQVAPVRLQSLMPYRATVDMPAAGWLETPRLFLPGYAVTVDGNPMPVEASEQQLITVPLEKGPHIVELRFEGSTKLRIAWWISALTWAGFMVWSTRRKPEPS